MLLLILTLHACALTRTISLSYHGVSLSFHLVTKAFQLVTRYFTFPVRFQLNSDFSHTFLNGQLTCHTIRLRNCNTFFSLSINCNFFYLLFFIYVYYYYYYYYCYYYFAIIQAVEISCILLGVLSHLTEPVL